MVPWIAGFCYDWLKVCSCSLQSTPTSAAFTAQLFDAVHGVALALSDLVNKKVISRTSDVQTVRDNLYQKLRTFNDPSTGFPSATGTNNVMFFNQDQDAPPLYDVVNLVVSLKDMYLTVNPLSPNIHKQILQTDLQTFPSRIS